MQLYIVRHGIAVDPSERACPSDPRRYLTDEGKVKTRKAAEGLRVLGVEPEVVLTSPYVRAVQTAEIVANELRGSTGVLRETQALRPGASPADLYAELSRDDAESILCVGHAPHVDELIALALGVARPFTALKKAGAAALDLALTSPPQGTLEWLMTPKSLRRLRK